MKKRINFILLSLVIIVSSMVIFLSIFNGEDLSNHDEAASPIACEVPPAKVNSKKQLINLLNSDYSDKIRTNYGTKSLELYFSKENDKFVECNEYSVTKNDILITYRYGQEKVNFIWEYGVEDAELLLQNTVEQFGLEKISDSPDLYTYVGWQDLESDIIDIFWVQDDSSFIANVPKEMLLNNKQDILKFCNATKKYVE